MACFCFRWRFGLARIRLATPFWCYIIVWYMNWVCAVHKLLWKVSLKYPFPPIPAVSVEVSLSGAMRWPCLSAHSRRLANGIWVVCVVYKGQNMSYIAYHYRCDCESVVHCDWLLHIQYVEFSRRKSINGTCVNCQPFLFQKWPETMTMKCACSTHCFQFTDCHILYQVQANVNWYSQRDPNWIDSLIN